MNPIIKKCKITAMKVWKGVHCQSMINLRDEVIKVLGISVLFNNTPKNKNLTPSRSFPMYKNFESLFLKDSSLKHYQSKNAL